MPDYIVAVEPQDSDDIEKTLNLKFRNNIISTMVSNIWIIKSNQSLNDFQKTLKTILEAVKKETYIFVDYSRDYRSFSVGGISKRL